MDNESSSDATESLQSPESQECTKQQTEQIVDEKVEEIEASQSAEPQRGMPTSDDRCKSVGELQPALETYFAAPPSSSEETQLCSREESSSSATQQSPKSLSAVAAVITINNDIGRNPSDVQEQVVEFGEGPLGLTMRRSREDIVVVHSIADDTQAASSDMIVGDRILQLGSFDLRGMRVDKELWKRAIEHVKSSPRPLIVVYQRRTVSQPSVQNLAPPSPPQVSPLEAVSTYARKRTFVAKRKLMWARFLKEIGMPSRGRSVVDAADSHLVFDGPVAVWRQPHRLRALLTLVKQGDYFQRDRYALVFKRPTDNAAVFVVAAISNPKLVIATNKWRLPDTSLDVERCVVLDACKLRRKPRVEVPTGIPVFEISTPDGDVTLAIEREDQKVAWLSVLATLLLSATRTAVSVEGATGDYAEVSGIWRHHVLLGTPQSLAATTAAGAEPVSSSMRDETLGASDDAETADASSQLEEALEEILPGCSVNLRDADGRTALHIAAQRGAAEAVRALLEAGAERDVIDARASTPLHEAARGWHDAAVSLLLATAANKRSEIDTFEESADSLDCGDSSREGDAISSMLEARDVDGTTAVMATAYKRVHIGEARTNDGHSKRPVHHEQGLDRLSRTLLALSAWGAQLEARDGSGLCLLHRLALTQQADELEVVCRSCGVDATTRLLASPKPTEGDGTIVRVVEHFLQRGATALHVAFAGEIAAAQIKDPICKDAASLPKTCDVLTRYGCSAYDADANGNTAIELAFAVLEHTGDYSPGLQAAVCALCISVSEAADAESKPKQKPLVDIALGAAKQRGQRRSQQSSSFSTLVEALEAIKKERKRKISKSGSGLGGWFSNLTSSSADESQNESGLSTSSVTSGQSQPASRLPSAELQHEKKPAVPRNFASQAYRRSANDEKFRAELFSGSKQATSMSPSEKIEGQASGFEDLKNELSQRGERLGKLSEKSEVLANASEEFERMCRQLNRKKQGNSGWW